MLQPYMPAWLSGLTARLYGASQTVLEVNRQAGNGTEELVSPEPVGIGLSWLDSALDFSTWAVRPTALYSISTPTLNPKS